MAVSSDDIGLPPEPLTPLLPLLSAMRFGVETARRNVPALNRWAERRGLAMQREIIERLVGEKPVRYVPYADRKPSRTAAAVSAG